MKLHDYQQECLDTLADYFEEAAARGAKDAFQASVGRQYNRGSDFLPLELPYVCLKIPTGGGKTLIAAHSIGRVASAYAEDPSPTVLWLAPTGAIVDQTLKALAEGNPCREALENSFPGRVNPMSLADAYNLSKDELRECATVIVATIQSLRRESPDYLKIYGDAGGLMEHFQNLDQKTLDGLERENEEVIYSLANVLKMRRPMVIVDEAHNARTKLSFESLARFKPSCVVEFTATPQAQTTKTNTASNVLLQVSAARLKKAHMIKAPLDMRVNADVKTVIADAVAKQRELEEIAKAEKQDTGEYIRPIVLFQAGNEGSEMDPKRLREVLLTMDGITEEQVAISTGKKNQLAAIDNIMAPGELRFIITIKKLGEGWDCPFAYVLCSVGNITATRAVEQILGRILRLPNARAKKRGELNAAYAFAAHPDFHTAAEAVRKALEEGAGFSKLEARDFLPETSSQQSPLFSHDSLGAAEEKHSPLVVPRLTIREGEQLKLLTQSDFLGESWELATKDAKLPRFRTDIAEGRAVIDVNEAGNVYFTDFAQELRENVALFADDMAWTEVDLVKFVDRQFQHPDVPFAQSSAFIRKAVALLLQNPEMTAPKLARHRFRLARAVERRMEEHRRGERQCGMQKFLQGMDAAQRLETNSDYALEMRERDYAPNWYCENSGIFRLHAFPQVGELKKLGEEFECAHYLDNLPETEVWLRNLDHRRATSFWIPTSGDLFYPDFIVRLQGGRILVVEYKGKNLWTDAQEKRDLGALWEEHSGGKGIFVMVCNDIGAGLQEIDNAISGKKR